MPLAVHFRNRCSNSVVNTRLQVSSSRSHNRRACASVSLSPGISRYSLSIRSSSVEIRGVSRVCVTGRRSRVRGGAVGCSRADRASSRAYSARRAAGGWIGTERRDGIAVVVSGMPLGEANTGPAAPRGTMRVDPGVGMTCRRGHCLGASPRHVEAFLLKRGRQSESALRSPTGTPCPRLPAVRDVPTAHSTHTRKSVPSHWSASRQ